MILCLQTIMKTGKITTFESFRKNVYKFFQLVSEGWSNRDS